MRILPPSKGDRQQIEQHQEHINQDGVDRHHGDRQEEQLVPRIRGTVSSDLDQ